MTTYEQLDFESDSGSTLIPDNLRRPRLVDDGFLRNDTGLWKELFIFRRRFYGSIGAKMIWNEFRSLPDPTERDTYHNQELWESFLELGLQDLEVLDQLVDYVAMMYRARNLIPTNHLSFYCTVMGHILRHNPNDASHFHNRLGPLGPSIKQLVTLTRTLGDFEPGIRALQSLSNTISSKNIYNLIVPGLCKHGFFKAASLWHHFLLKKKDLPLNQNVAMPLIKYLQATQNEEQARQVVEGMIEAGVPVQGMQPLEPNYYNPTMKFSDQFCARLFATKFFTIETIINGLNMAQVKTIGPLAMREILLRTSKDNVCDSHLVLQYLELLSASGISIGASTFCCLVSKVARKGDSRLLNEIAICDQHPDVFDDGELQESLLVHYQRMGDVRQAERTLAICTFHEWEKSIPIARGNVLLRAALTRGDHDEMQVLLTEMVAQGCPVDRKSRSHMFQCIVLRNASLRLITMSVYKLVNIWKRLLVCGNTIDPAEWLETFKILGKFRLLEEFEELALWLVQWYSKGKFKDLQVDTRSLSPRTKEHSPSKLEDVYSVLFPDTTAYATIIRGFQSASSTKAKNIKIKMMEQETTSLTEHQSLWGLRFLVKLRELGVPVETRTVYRACRMGLIFIFGPGRPVRPIAGLKDYVLAMQKIWGPELFSHRNESVRKFCEDVHLRINAKWGHKKSQLNNSMTEQANAVIR